MDADVTLRGADLVARRLFKAGCRFAFGIPGGEVLTLMDALAKAGIAFHLCKHENAGGFMAEGTHHASGAPAVLVATVGPGVANAVNVVANAYQDQVPMIFLTGAVDGAEAQTYTHQVFDHGALLGPICKASFVLQPGAVDVMIDKAVAIAGDGRPGPVHVDVPIRIADAPEGESPLVRRAPPLPVAPAPGPDLDAAREVFTGAKRPLMIAGIDVLHDGAADAVRKFAETFQVPVITTYKAKGVIPEDDPLSLGAAGLSPLADDRLLPLVKASDCVVLAGYDPIEMRIGWRAPWGPDTPVIEFSAAANTHYVHQASHAFVCHVGAGLGALAAGLTPRNDVWADGAPGAVRADLKSTFSSGGDWGAAAVIEAARRALPREGVITVDTGAHRILLSQVWEAYAPRTVLQSTALCTMGDALPLAIGRKLAEPSRPVIAFTGDAGLEMVLGELATLRDLKLPVVIVVFVDAALALIEMKQRARGLDPLAVAFGATDFPAVAQAMGGAGLVAATAEAVEDAVRAGLEAETFTLIACPVGERPYDGTF